MLNPANDWNEAKRLNGLNDLNGLQFVELLLANVRAAIRCKSNLSPFSPAVITCVVEGDPFQRWF